MPTTVNDKILDDIISRSVDISRYEPVLKKQVAKVLNQIEKDLVADVVKIDPSAPRYLIHRQNRLNKLIKQSRKTIASGYSEINKINSKATQELAVIEGDWSEDLLTKFVSDPVAVQMNTVAVPEVLLKELAKETLIDGATSKQWWAKQGGDLSDKFVRSMRAGVYAGESLPNLLKRIKNPNNVGYIGIKTVSKSQAEALVRTSVQNVTNRAREATYAANSHLIKSLKWISTLDTRTTPFCIQRDNKLYTVDHKPIGHRFPWFGGPGSIHWQCRSTTTVILKAAFELGLDTKDMRYSMTGDVPADTDYINWLKKQDVFTQNKTLGKTRAKLFRTGKVKNFNTLVDQNGRFRKLESLSAYKKGKKAA